MGTNMRVRQSIPNLLGGVSQLPDRFMAENEVRGMENVLLSRHDGARKRPPTSHVGVIDPDTSAIPAKPFVQTVKRTDGDYYTIAVMNGELFVYDAMTGEQKQVLTPNGMEYLTSVTGFRTATIGDTTIIVNKDKTVNKKQDRAPAKQYEALIYVRKADYNTTYKIVLHGRTTITYTTASPGASDAKLTLASEQVAIGIYGALLTNTYVKTHYTVTFFGSSVHLQRNDGGDFAIEAGDSISDTGLSIVKDTVQRLEDLPPKAKQGMVVKVMGDIGTRKDDFWVRYEDAAEASLGGVWREVPAPGASTGMDPDTMPWALTRHGSLVGQLTVSQDPLGPIIDYYNSSGSDEFPEGTNGWDSNGEPNTVVNLTTHDEYSPERSIPGSSSVVGDGLLTVYFDVDCTDVKTSNLVTVELQIDNLDGSGFKTHDKTRVAGGQRRFNLWLRSQYGTYEYHAKARIRLTYWDTTDQRGKVALHQRNHPQYPGLKWGTAPRWRVQYPNAQVYPVGHTETIRTGAFSQNLGDLASSQAYVQVSYTVTTPGFTGSQLNDEMRRLLSDAWAAHALGSGMSVFDDGGGGFIVWADKEFAQHWAEPHSDLGGIHNYIGEHFYVDRTSHVLATDTFYTYDREFAVGSLVGKTLKNLTDGSTGVISANYSNYITVTGLSGGARNSFEVGDKVEVVGTDGEYFLFDRIKWSDRLAGDDNNCPLPSFVDKRINEVFFYQNRLGFCSGENIVMSAAGDLFRFTRRTATDLLADDPIDVTSSHQDIAEFGAAVAWKERLYLFSPAGHQFALSGEPVLTPESVRLEHVGSHQCSLDTRPVTIGDHLFFVRKTGDYLKVMEMSLDENGKAVAVDLTKKVPRYIQGSLLDMTGDANSGCLFVLTTANTSKDVYVYNFEKNERGQDLLSAWHKWTFGEQVLTIDMIDGYLYMAIVRAAHATWGQGGVMLERIDLTVPTNLDVFHYDRHNTMNVAKQYILKIDLPMLQFRDENGDAVVEGKLNIQYVTVNYHKTGLLQVSVVRNNMPGHNQTVFLPGSGDGTAGFERVAVLGDAKSFTIKLSCEHQYGVGIGGIDWEGYFSRR